MRFHPCFAFLALAAATAPAAAQNGAASDSPIVVERDKDPKQKKVCSKSVATGSIMTKRVCRTVAQIELEQAHTERSLERMVNQQETMQQVREQCEVLGCKK